MLASSGVTRNTVIMYATQGWSLYHRMGRVYYQNIWLQKKAKCLRAIWNFFVGDILAIHHSDSALTVDVLMSRIDNLFETSS